MGFRSFSRKCNINTLVTVTVNREPILINVETKNYIWRPPTMQNCISIRRRGWSWQIPSLPLFEFF